MRASSEYLAPPEREGEFIEVNEIYNEMRNGTCEDNFLKLEQFSDNGNSFAGYYIGVVYRFGICVPKNIFMAKSFLKKSALDGYGEAAYQLGRIYIEERMFDLACVEFRAASQSRVANSDFWLYKSLLNTREFSLDELNETILRSIEQGNVTAMADYGALLLSGRFGKRRIIKGAVYKIKSIISYIRMAVERKTIRDQID